MCALVISASVEGDLQAGGDKSDAEASDGGAKAVSRGSDCRSTALAQEESPHLEGISPQEMVTAMHSADGQDKEVSPPPPEAEAPSWGPPCKPRAQVSSCRRHECRGQRQPFCKRQCPDFRWSPGARDIPPLLMVSPSMVSQGLWEDLGR